MPKLRIGEKVVVGEEKAGRRVFTNGHKTFTSAECRGLLELQARERSAVTNFEANKHTLIRNRNPITGGVTPRTKVNLKGEVIQQTGELLFLPKHYPPKTQSQIEEEEEAQRKAAEENPLRRSDRVDERISNLQNLQDVMGGEIEYLKMKLAEKQSSLQTKGTSRDFRF